MFDNTEIRFSLKGRIREFGSAKNRGRGVFEVESFLPPLILDGVLLNIERRTHPLWLKTFYNPKIDETVVDIYGSWRKWYLGAGTTRDLFFKDAIHCIEAIAQKIGVPTDKVKYAKIIKVELGMSLRFWENMGGIIDGLVYYKGFERDFEHERESVRFGSSDYSIVFYDKHSQLMSVSEKELKKKEKAEARKKGEYVKNRRSKKLLAKKLNDNSFSLRFEVRVTKVEGCPPEFAKGTGKNREVLIKTPADILENWDTLLDGLNTIFCNVQFSEYNLNVGVEFLKDKGVTELSMYESHITAMAVGGANNYVQILMRQLDSGHRNKNIKNRIAILNSPPPELKKALKSCRNKKKLLFETKDKRIEELRKRG
ncbi:MAG: hypothetical protein COA33_010440 [Fluviicola sp.]|nr:hypothetical protein [Fluviicola sp.]